VLQGGLEHRAEVVLVVDQQQLLTRHGCQGGTIGWEFPVKVLRELPARGSCQTRPVRAFRIAVPASDLDRSRAFYERVLGIDADCTVPSRLYFHCGEFVVALVDLSTEASVHPLPDHLYFATGQLEHVFERVVAAGADITSPIEGRPWGERSFYCRDPDGHPLCFVDDGTLFLGRGADWS